MSVLSFLFRANRHVFLLGLIGLVILSLSGMGCKEQTCENNDGCLAGQHCNDEGKCQANCVDASGCLDGQGCNTTTGTCQTCQAKAKRQCVGSASHWFDSCGNQGEKVEDCTEGCSNGVCKGNGKSCGNGTCEPGLEDCLSCAQDCKCASGESCVGGTCTANDTCGNGTCDKGVEDCASCPSDCGCPVGNICQTNSCQPQPSCGDGVCSSAKNENCLSCPRDCICPQGKQCANTTQQCVDTCGDGTCNAAQGENCSTCPRDCACQTNQRCAQGVCSILCGNGQCDTSYGETCSTCAKDCPCGANIRCQDGNCGTSCGNGQCEEANGENCSTCPKDCGCPNTSTCNTGKCRSRCGNGVCDASNGETCASCPEDCGCPTGNVCQSGACVKRCGDGTCDASNGENCSTCPKDCGCPNGRVCKSGTCAESVCGSCKGRTICTDGKCVCNHECDPIGKSTCVGNTRFERCVLDEQGCRYWKAIDCPSGKTCNNGSCCASGCQPGQECGTDSCGSSCGTCPTRATCTSGKCICNHECSTVSQTQCVGTTKYKVCISDGKGCRYWSSGLTCPGGGTCQKNTCCKKQCSNRECGGDGCGGVCGTCTYSCQNNQCKRKLVVASVYLPCGLCSDNIPFYRKPDPMVKLTLSDGQTFQSTEQDDLCDVTVTFTWSVPNLDPALLKNAKIEVYDYDSVDAHDLCVGWVGDFSKPGKQTFSHTKKAVLKIEVLK